MIKIWICNDKMCALNIIFNHDITENVRKKSIKSLAAKSKELKGKKYLNLSPSYLSLRSARRRLNIHGFPTLSWRQM